jgi:ABC-type uncharacterized transport system auxiliary subunit
MRNGVRQARMGALVLAVLALTGCGGLRSDAAPDRIYVLNTVTPAAGAVVVPGVLIVPRPVVQPGLDTDRIALARNGNELDYYAASRWSAPLPQVLGAFAVRSMAGSFATVVGNERGVGPGDFELLLTARHFEAVQEAGGAPVVRVTLECLLVAAVPRRVLGSCDAEAREPAAENRMVAIVQAYERAAQRALAEVRSKAQAAAAKR